MKRCLRCSKGFYPSHGNQRLRASCRASRRGGGRIFGRVAFGVRRCDYCRREFEAYASHARFCSRRSSSTCRGSALRSTRLQCWWGLKRCPLRRAAPSTRRGAATASSGATSRARSADSRDSGGSRKLAAGTRTSSGSGCGGETPAPSPLTLAELVDEYLAQHVAEANTIRALGDRLKLATAGIPGEAASLRARARPRSDPRRPPGRAHSGRVEAATPRGLRTRTGRYGRCSPTRCGRS
jgi:hypothetical protein